VCAYTFFSQHIGVFADAIIADCGDDGLMDLDAIAALPEDQWDGLVVTNLFAGLRDLRRFTAFCQARGKALIVDSAAALFGPDRERTGCPAEAISFHHTKPWGFGEGGCVVVDRADVPLVRSAINLGIGGPELLKPFAGNGKISDIACAPILERLERLPAWAPSYQTQRARIEGQCAEAGLRLLLEAPREALLASIPVLAARPVARTELASFDFDIGKYHPPLSGIGPTARRLFAHIVNIPSHGGMAVVDEAALASALRTIAVPPAGDAAAGT
ncbi:MAG: DegT/DnrJ/EryC1/StrS family aminotransferase, partial [Dongiaceae bacterium]